MKKGKFTNSTSAKRSGIKLVALVLVMALLIGGAIGGTLAWLTDTTKSVTNTFTAADINITLEESENLNLQMIPGVTREKDPRVTVKANSEACWLFIQVTESTDPKLSDYIVYAVDTTTTVTTVEGVIYGGWSKGNGTDIPANVYYRQVDKTNADKVFAILAGGSYQDPMGTANNTDDDVTVTWTANQVGVKPSVTKTMMEAIDGTGEDKPTLTFTAYASQLMKNNTDEFSAADAWAIAKPVTP